MPYKIPNIPTFTLKGIDAKIQDLQTILGDHLSWLDYSFGLCEHATRQEGGEVITYPAQWSANKTDYMDLRPFPDDTYSYAFWDMDDPAEVVYNEGMPAGKRKFAHYRYSVACIIVADINQIDNTSTFNETKSKLRQDIINIFETHADMLTFAGTFWITNIYEHDITQIFKGFTINKPDDWKFPYQAFRIEGQLSFKRVCPVSNIYTITSQISSTGNEPMVYGDGSAYLASGASTDLMPSEGFEIEFVFYYGAESEDYSGWFGIYTNTGDYIEFRIWGIASRTISYSTVCDGEAPAANSVIIDPGVITAGNFYTIKITWTGSTIDVYVNDVLVITDATMWDINDITGASAILCVMNNDTVGSNPLLTDHSMLSFEYTTGGSAIVLYPICEESGNIVYNVLANNLHLTGQAGFSAATWLRNNILYKYLKDYGYRLAAGVYIPALLDGSSAADGNSLTNVPPYTEFN